MRTKKKTSHVMARVEPEVKQRLQRVSRLHESSESEIVRESLILFLDWAEKNAKE